VDSPLKQFADICPTFKKFQFWKSNIDKFAILEI